MNVLVDDEVGNLHLAGNEGGLNHDGTKGLLQSRAQSMITEILIKVMSDLDWTCLSCGHADL